MAELLLRWIRASNLLAAARDVDYCGNLNMKDGIRMRYTKEVLGMRQPYDYFQAGVLVLNTKAMRKLHPMEKWLEFASDDRYIYNDQDILNAHCQGRVKYLDYDWNVMTDCFGRIGNVFSFAPCAIFDAFNDSRNHEKIVHYAGAQKPWKMMGCDRFDRILGVCEGHPLLRSAEQYVACGSCKADDSGASCNR